MAIHVKPTPIDIQKKAYIGINRYHSFTEKVISHLIGRNNLEGFHQCYLK